MTPEQIAAMVNRLKLAKITGCRAAYALLGATPLDKINADIAAAADLIEAQAVELAEMRSKQTYRYIGKDGKMILARDLEDQRDALSAALAALTAWRDAQ